MSVIKIKDDNGNWVPLNRLIKPSSIPKVVNTSNYQVPATGGDFWIDTVAAGGDVTLALPGNPAIGTTVSTQIVDNGANKLFLSPAAPDVMAFENPGLAGRYAGVARNLIEILRYVGGRWLPYYGRLVYQVALVAIVLPPETVFFAMFEGADGSNTFTDLRSNPISIRSGSPVISTAKSMFGDGSLYLNGFSSLSVPAAPTLVSGAGEFRWDIALYPTAFTTGESQGLLDHRATANNTPEAINIRNQDGLGTIEHFDGTTRIGLARLKLNQWQILSIERYQGIKTIYLDDLPIYSAADTVNYVYAGNLIIGDIVDTAFPFSGMFQGYIQYVRKTVGSNRKQGYGSNSNTFARQPLTDADPLEPFKIVDLTFDTGAIIDRKGNSITLGGVPTTSTAQKRFGSHSLALSGAQHLDLTVPAANFASSPYTISTAFRLSAVGSVNNFTTPNLQYLFDCGAGNTSAINWYGFDSKLALVNASANQCSITQVPVANIWYDAALVKLDTKYLLLLNNQVVAAANTAPTSVDLSGSSIRVGRDKISGNAGLTGFVDNFAIYNCANGSNLTHNYTLRFLARFSGGSVNDELGAVGTIVGVAPIHDTASKRSLEASALFAGSGHITYPQIPAYNLGAGGFEIAGWAKGSPSQVQYPGLITIGETTTLIDGQTISVFASIDGFTGLNGKSATNKLAVFIGFVSTSQPTLVSTTSFNDDLPHYWRIIKYIIGASACTVMVVDGKIEDVYIGSYTIAPTTRPVIVGSNGYDPTNRRFNGNLDDIAIYKA
jgi:Concanavalin A-like lectin/glucanases superfamily